MSARIDPWKDRQADLAVVLAALAAGSTLRQAAAAAAGVHVATLCRWQARSEAVALALTQARPPHPPLADPFAPYQQRPTVSWHPRCPCCDGVVVTQQVRGWYWWACIFCAWKSWRPRHPENCPHCGSHRLWSWDRRSIVCAGCGVRVRATHGA